MKGKGCLWDERCSKHLESLERLVFFLHGRGLYSLGGGNPNGCCAGSEFGRAGSVECSSGHTRTLCSVHTIVLLNCTIVRLYYCTCTLAHLHYWTLLLLIAGYALYCTVLLLHFYCSLLTLLHSSAQFHNCTFAL